MRRRRPVAPILAAIGKGVGRPAVHEFAPTSADRPSTAVPTCGATSTGSRHVPSSTMASCSGTSRGRCCRSGSNVRDQQVGRASALRSMILGHELHLCLGARRQTNSRTLRRVGGLSPDRRLAGVIPPARPSRPPDCATFTLTTGARLGAYKDLGDRRRRDGAGIPCARHDVGSRHACPATCCRLS